MAYYRLKRGYPPIEEESKMIYDVRSANRLSAISRWNEEIKLWENCVKFLKLVNNEINDENQKSVIEDAVFVLTQHLENLSACLKELKGKAILSPLKWEVAFLVKILLAEEREIRKSFWELLEQDWFKKIFREKYSPLY
jgi:hypothetical protein